MTPRQLWESINPLWKLGGFAVAVISALYSLYVTAESNDWPRPGFRPALDKWVAKEVSKIEQRAVVVEQKADRNAVETLNTRQDVLSTQESLLQWKLEEVQEILSKSPNNQLARRQAQEFQRHIDYLRSEHEKIDRRKGELERR